MADSQHSHHGIFSLPNEILLNIFDTYPTKQLIRLTPTCQKFHTLVLRLLHRRLELAADLQNHTLYIECYPPSAEYTPTAKKKPCIAMGTKGLDELLSGIHDDDSYLGQVKTVFGLYSRFRPYVKQAPLLPWRHPAIDVRGSRTHPDSREKPRESGPDDLVSQTVYIDAQDLFSQLETRTTLGKKNFEGSVLTNFLAINKGTIRVWRHWLSDHCESKTWSDGESIAVHHEGPACTSDETEAHRPKDPRVLWLNTGDQNMGLKIRVKEREWHHTNPATMPSDVDAAVSYRVEFEEVYVRTTHLLLKLEEAQAMVDEGRGKALVFGSFRGP